MKNVARDLETATKQQCTVLSLYFSGAVGVILYVAGLVFLAYRKNWAALPLWLVLLPSLKWAYLRFFPRISKWTGYGRVDDKLPASVKRAPVEVTYYSLLGCPFCPIVEQRLKRLQKEMDFTLTTIDLTLKPQLSASKGIRSVPVVEVGKDRLVGNATTERLAQLISHAQSPGLSRAS
ncbi:MAG: glutaredoxin domain-containing protein [Candidatus Acidiferrales bacterium]|jgi:glutaredoxin